jgi:hypothetical protein
LVTICNFKDNQEERVTVSKANESKNEIENESASTINSSSNPNADKNAIENNSESTTNGSKNENEQTNKME